MKSRADQAAAVARRIPRVPNLLPEHVVVAETKGAPATDSAVLDQWGRAHRLPPVTTIGRDPIHATIAVLDPSVSRLHAELRRDRDRWVVRDLGSTNGTSIEGRQLERPTEIGDLQLVVVGDIGFVFVLDASSLRSASPTESLRATVATPREGRGAALRLLEPTGGGGGVVEYDGTQVQLGPTQFALVQLLAKRYLKELAQADEVRGFVRSSEITVELPWDTAHPDENHVKQLVRRVRRALEKAGLQEAIEARHGFGYRLRVRPTGAI